MNVVSIPCYCFKCVVILKAHDWVSPTEVSADITKTFHTDIVHLLSHCGIWMESHITSQLQASLNSNKSVSPGPKVSLSAFSHDHMASGERSHHKI